MLNLQYGLRNSQIMLKSQIFRSFCQKATKNKISSKSSIFSKSFGQPTSTTHPHLIKKDEITPLITKSEFQTRRYNLMESVQHHMNTFNSNIKQHVIVVPSSSKQYMSDKIPYNFRQNTEFLYLSGCQEPDSCIVLIIDTTNNNPFHVTLFMRDKDDYLELWDGPRTGPENATELFGVDETLPMSQLQSYIQLLLNPNKSTSLWYDYTNPSQVDVHKVMNHVLNKMGQKMWESPKTFIQHQRIIKSPSEITLMRQTCKIASEAIIKTINTSKPGIDEQEIFATVDYQCRIRGAEILAYPPVVAGGPRATIIHYINNNQIVNNNDMVLLDAGCEFHGYSSDITRTWPVNGKFTHQQRILYEIILDVQNELIKLCNSFPSLDSLLNSMYVLLGKNLQAAGFIPKDVNEQNLSRMASQFCPHHVSHYLGMDVHDTPLISKRINIQPGMIITIEPGNRENRLGCSERIYINEKMESVPKEFRGIGIRIEDDVLITENGPDVLTKYCPKEISDLERVSKKG